MQTNPVIQFENLPASFREAGRRTRILLLLYAVVILASVAGSLFLMSSLNARRLVLTDGVPMEAERMTREDAIVYGYMDRNLIDSFNKAADYEQRE